MDKAEPEETPAAPTASGIARVQAHLEVVRSALVVAAIALERQNVDCDPEVARVLRYCAAERLSSQIERLSTFAAALRSG